MSRLTITGFESTWFNLTNLFGFRPVKPHRNGFTDSLLASSDLSLGSLSEAVTARNIDDVEKILRGADLRDITLNFMGHSPLHLAIGWPAGVAALVDAIPHLINLPSAGELPIHYACYIGCYESVRILLDHDSHLDGNEGHAVLYAIKSGDDKTIDLLIDALANRRLRLRDLARLYLPQATLAKLKMDRVPDADVPFIVHELEGLSVPIPEAIHPGSLSRVWGTVYHALYSVCKPFLPVVAEKLYVAGFLDIDCPNKDGRTPLMEGPWRYAFFRGDDDASLAHWLLSKGAESLTLPPGNDLPEQTGALPIHFLARRIGSAMFMAFTQDDHRQMLTKMLQPSLSRVLLVIALYPVGDNCSCSCAPNGWGCTPITILLRLLRGPDRDKKTQARLLFFLAWLSPLLARFLSRMESRDGRAKALEWRWHYIKPIIRFLTFEALGLRHICCLVDDGKDLFNTRQQFTRRNYEDIAAIAESQLRRDDLMESVYQDCKAMMVNCDEPLYALLANHWAPRIREVLAQQEEDIGSSNGSVVPDAGGLDSEEYSEEEVFQDANEEIPEELEGETREEDQEDAEETDDFGWSFDLFQKFLLISQGALN
jgi:Ankyrin repeats (3 copies)